jgi:hypothetical protein
VYRVLTRYRCPRLAHLDRGTGCPIRRCKHDQPGDLIHLDVKKLGNIPDGGGRHTGGHERPRHHHGAQEQSSHPRDGFLHTLQPAPRSLHAGWVARTLLSSLCPL